MHQRGGKAITVKVGRLAHFHSNREAQLSILITTSEDPGNRTPRSVRPAEGCSHSVESGPTTTSPAPAASAAGAVIFHAASGGEATEARPAFYPLVPHRLLENALSSSGSWGFLEDVGSQRATAGGTGSIVRHFAANPCARALAIVVSVMLALPIGPLLVLQPRQRHRCAPRRP
jgi:hypothetical protein